MKKISPLLLLVVIVTIQAHAQSYQGFRTGNHTGVNGVFFNPANVADSRYSWDLNLVSVSALLGNDKASLRLKDVTENFDGDSLLNQFTKGGRTNGLMYTDVHGPSFMFNMGKKSALAFTTRAIVIANISNIDGALIDQFSDAINDITYPYSVSMPGKSGIAAHAYMEYGVTYGRVLTNNDSKHFLKAGLTAKYLSGAGNFYMQFNDFKATLNNEPVTERKYLNNTSGTVALGFGGTAFSDFEVSDLLKSSSSGFGADLGFIYELRTANTSDFRDRSINKYKLRIGAALQNFGSISYTRDANRSASYRANITGSQRFYTDELEEADIDSIKSVLDRYPQFFSPNAPGTGKYKAALPALLSLDADYHIHRGFYVNAALQLPLTSKTGDAWNSYQYTSVTVTPRYENKWLGMYVPLSYHDLTGVTAGLGIRLGPLFVGSGSIVNAVTGKTKQADVYLGLHVGSLFGRK